MFKEMLIALIRLLPIVYMDQLNIMQPIKTYRNLSQ